jgi:hypothetical protein
MDVSFSETGKLRGVPKFHESASLMIEEQADYSPR